jgi:SAM-dependent methyltransferase
VIALMPDLQGVSHWPRDEPGLVGMCGEDSLPLDDNSVDRALLVHALEASEQLRRLLRELWRVLAGGGRMIVVVPNRRGVWARLERTPFGHGHPYSEPQLGRLLRDNLFVPIRSEYALYMPPSRTRMALKLAGPWERVGARWAHPFGGVVITEAEKQVYAGSPLRLTRRARRPVVVPARPVPSPWGGAACARPRPGGAA